MNKIEELELIRLLGKVTTKMSDDLYNALAAVRPQPAIEMVILRPCAKGFEVLLFRRPPEDKYWANLWHSPGTILRNRESVYEAFERLEKKELGFSFQQEPVFVGWRNTMESQSKREHEISLVHVYLVRAGFKPSRGKFFSVNNLPLDIIPYHLEIIQIAVGFLLK